MAFFFQDRIPDRNYTNEHMSYSFFGMPNCFILVAIQVPLGISKKE